MVIEIFLLALLLLFILFASLFYVIPFLFGAPYEPTKKAGIEKILKLAGNIKNKKIAELGSGNSRVAISFAKKGAFVDGFEINPFLVFYSRRKIKELNLQGKIKIYNKSFWKTDFGKYDLIYTFQFRTITDRLEKKIMAEAKKGTKIISNCWEFPNLKLKKRIGKFYLYEV